MGGLLKEDKGQKRRQRRRQRGGSYQSVGTRVTEERERLEVSRAHFFLREHKGTVLSGPYRKVNRDT